ncbi:MAG: GNAT family N-acetyltransferase [Bacillota bacterium]|jgi:ribosomal protein S18 acetylase RimI-like enzyme
MHIRRASKSDIQGIQRVAEVTWRSAYDGVLRPDTVDNVLAEFYSEDSLKHSLEHPAVVFLVAEDNEQVVGFIQALPRPGKTDYELTRLYILPEYQRRGIGRQLQLNVEQQLDGRRLWVLVEQDIRGAIAFFHALGFTGQRTLELPIFGETLPFLEMSK